MKKSYLLAAFSGLMFSAQAQQTQLQNAVFTTGGNYAVSDNTVKVWKFNPSDSSVVVMDSVLGDFSNEVLVHGHIAYVHVGRGFGHPSGNDVLLVYDLISNQKLDSLENVSGLTRMLVHDSLLLISKGFGASGASFEVRNKSNISDLLFSDSSIPSFSAGLELHQGKAYLGVDDQNVGKIACFDLQSLALDTVFELDSLSAGMQSIQRHQNTLYISSTRYSPNFSVLYNALTKFDIQNFAFQSDTSVQAGKLFTLYQDEVFGRLNGHGIARLNPLNDSISAFSTVSPTALQFDSLSNTAFYLSTDYFSFGEFGSLNTSGGTQFSQATDISGSALQLHYNHQPKIDNAGQIDFAGGIKVKVNDIDFADSFELGQANVTNGANATFSFSGDSIFIQSTSALIEFSFTACDRGGLCDTVNTSYVNQTSTQQLHSKLEWNVYPNPTNKVLTISGLYDLQRVDIYSISGALLASYSQQTMDVSNLAEGVYILKAYTLQSVHTKKFIKQ